jgi:hypothetical protein
MDKGYFPILLSINHDYNKKNIAIKFILAGVSDLQIVYIMSKDHKILMRYFQTPGNNCG